MKLVTNEIVGDFSLDAPEAILSRYIAGRGSIYCRSRPLGEDQLDVHNGANGHLNSRSTKWTAKVFSWAGVKCASSSQIVMRGSLGQLFSLLNQNIRVMIEE